MTVPATIGLAVNSGTWALISMVEPCLQRCYDLGSLARAAAIAPPLIVSALGCVPIGALSDTVAPG
jgi:hypothetical protein